jgi:pimeloyl-ACP methyl ester carboxylesterase
MGENGLLQVISPRGIDIVDLPARRYGLATPVWDVPSGQPVALMEPFKLHALAGWVAELAWLEQQTAELRKNDQSLEFTTASVTLEGQTAIVRAAQGLTCVRTYLVRPGKAQFLDRSCDAERADLGSPKVSPVELRGEQAVLKGRLYTWPTTGRTRGLLIAFEGGPDANSGQQRPWIPAQALSDRFDVLVVDYRGSTGFGWSNLTALRQPLSRIAADDVSAATNWARRQAAYRGKTIGFWGDSFGGYAGLVSLAAKTERLDFVVANSAFIENRMSWRTTQCATEGLHRLIFGMTTDEAGECIMSDAQLMKMTIRSKVPVLSLVGEKDQQSSAEIAHQWAQNARAQGACLTEISSLSGGHMLKWPVDARNAALVDIRKWVENAVMKSPEACGVSSVLP